MTLNQLDYYVWDQNPEECEAVSAESARGAAMEYVDCGAWGDDEHTMWVRVHVATTDPRGYDLDEIDIDIESIKVPIYPDAPPCDRGCDHIWVAPHAVVGGLADNPGVVGSGAGIRIVEACAICGCSKTEDTWATDPSDGEQGLRSISYHRHEHTGDMEDAVYAAIDGCADRQERIDALASALRCDAAEAEAVLDAYGGDA